jgi:hypothetical protein
MMKINGYILPKELSKFFIATFLMYLIGLFILIPVAIYVLAPFVAFVFHGVPFSVSQASALRFDKMCYFVLFASLWISFILWIRELAIWYQRVSKQK